MDPADDLKKRMRQCQEAAFLLRWYGRMKLAEGEKGGPKRGWRDDALRRALQLIADHNGLEFFEGY